MCTAFHDNEEYKTIEGFLTCTDPEDPSYFARAPTTATANKSSKWKGGVHQDDVSLQNSLTASIYGTNVSVIPKPAKNSKAAEGNSSFLCSPTPLTGMHTSSIVEEELAVAGGFFTCDDPEREGHIMLDPLEVMPTCESYPKQLMSRYAELLHNDNAADTDYYSINNVRNNNIYRTTAARDQPPQPRSVASTSLAANSYAAPSPRSTTATMTPTGSQVQVWSKSQQLLSESREEMSMITDFLTCQDPTENEITPRSAPNSRSTNNNNDAHAHKAQYVYDYDPQKAELTFSTTAASMASSSPRRPHPAPASSITTNLTSLTMTSLPSDHQLCKVFEDDEYVTFRKVKPSQSTLNTTAAAAANTAANTTTAPTYQPRAEVELISKFNDEDEDDDWPVVAVHREARKKAQRQQRQQFQKQQHVHDDNYQRMPWVQQNNKKESQPRRGTTGASTRGRRGRGHRRDADDGSPVSSSSRSEHSRKSWGRMMF